MRFFDLFQPVSRASGLPRDPDQVPAAVKKQFRPTAVVSKSPGATNPLEVKRLAFGLENIKVVFKFSSDLVNQLDFHWPIKSNPNSLLWRGPIMSHCPPFTSSRTIAARSAVLRIQVCSEHALASP